VRAHGKAPSRRRSKAQGSTKAGLAPRLHRLERRAGRLITLATGAACGYLMDPQEGPRRRAQLLTSLRRLLETRATGLPFAAARRQADEPHAKGSVTMPFMRPVDDGRAATQEVGTTPGQHSTRNSPESNTGTKA